MKKVAWKATLEEPEAAVSVIFDSDIEDEMQIEEGHVLDQDDKKDENEN